jgi:hypothetical protein
LGLGLGREAAAPVAIYEELDVRFKPTKTSGRRRTPSSSPTRLRARGRRHRLHAGPECQSEKGKEGRGRLAALAGWAGPIRDARQEELGSLIDEAEWASGW